MYTVTVSPKFQVVIPQAICKSLELQPGQKVQAILYENRIELIPIKPQDLRSLPSRKLNEAELEFSTPFISIF
jgi:AbrB family looped-hinge helix DNA binding protein